MGEGGRLESQHQSFREKKKERKKKNWMITIHLVVISLGVEFLHESSPFVGNISQACSVLWRNIKELIL